MNSAIIPAALFSDAERAQVRAVDRLEDVTADPQREEVVGCKGGVGDEGRLVPGQLEIELPGDAVALGTGQPGCRLEAAIERRIVEQREIAVALLLDVAPVEERDEEAKWVGVVHDPAW